MKLPNGERARIDDAKLLEYCLSTTHPRGRHKARLFAAAAGITAAHADLLKAALLSAARNGDATPTKQNLYGQFFQIEFPLAGPSGAVQVLSVWLVAVDDPV